MSTPIADPTIGESYRGPYGSLVRVTGIIENSRASLNHISIPGAVVVSCEPVGPGYGHTSAWSSDLSPAQPGDIGAHPHFPDCPCGIVIPGHTSGWRAVEAPWRRAVA